MESIEIIRSRSNFWEFKLLSFVDNYLGSQQNEQVSLTFFPEDSAYF
jgi:hypothetical protein